MPISNLKILRETTPTFSKQLFLLSPLWVCTLIWKLVSPLRCSQWTLPLFLLPSQIRFSDSFEHVIPSYKGLVLKDESITLLIKVIRVYSIVNMEQNIKITWIVWKCEVSFFSSGISDSINSYVLKPHCTLLDPFLQTSFITQVLFCFHQNIC